MGTRRPGSRGGHPPEPPAAQAAASIGTNRLRPLRSRFNVRGDPSGAVSAELDLIILGSGMAGLNAMGVAAEAGKRVAIVERGKVGGTCPTRGCIPSKALIRSAEVAHEVRRAGEFGIRVGDVAVDFAAVMERVAGIIEKGSTGTRKWIDSLENVRLVEGEAVFEGPGAVRVDGQVLRAPRVIVATGAEPIRPPIPGLDVTPYLTSDDIWDVRELPGRLVMIGAGPVGLELAQALGRLGSRVTVVEVLPRLLPKEEPDLVEELMGLLAGEGMELVAGARIERVVTGPGGTRVVHLTVGGARRTLEADALLLGTGRRPSVGALNLDAAGVSGGPTGIPVDARLRTTRPSVWAAGDVLGPPFGAFTHVARRLGVEVAQNALDLHPHDVDRDVGPRAIFTDPELVSIGLSEAAARDAGYEVRVGSERFSGGKARAWGEERGSAKVVAEAGTGRILGASVLAYHACDLIHPVAVAMAGDGTGAAIDRAAHVHPTLGEVVKRAVAASSPG
jgi:pyruvate/2-oxoglutarate dehydrogenase complex dihydrolipoamide dehydrogenase (E3) component